MISCEEASVICNKSQYREATFFEIIKLKFHFLICKTCSKISSKNSRLTSLCGKAKLYSLTEQDKVKMKQYLKKDQ